GTNRLLLAAVVDEHGGPAAAEVNGAATGGSHRVIDQALQADVVDGDKIRDRRDQVRNVIGLRVELAVAELFAGDLEHLVAHNVTQVERLENEVQGALERYFFAQIDRDGSVAADAFLAEAAGLEMDVDGGQLGETGHHLAERRFLVAQQDGRLHPALDFQLALGAALDALFAAFALGDKIAPMLLIVLHFLA